MSKKDRFIFIGPGKCGTTSISKKLFEISKGDYRTFPHWFEMHNASKTANIYASEYFCWNGNHTSIVDVVKIFGINPDEWRIAGVARNPVDRIESLYAHTCRMVGQETSQEHFEEWLQYVFMNANSSLYRAHGRLRYHFEDEQSQILVNFVFSIEQAPAALEYLKPGLENNSYQLEHLNKSNRIGWVERIPSELKERLLQYIAEDLVFWEEIEKSGGYKYFR